MIPDPIELSEARMERCMASYVEGVCQGCGKEVGEDSLNCASPLGDGPALCPECLGIGPGQMSLEDFAESMGDYESVWGYDGDAL